MSSKRFGGVRFVVYPQDHLPRHVHAFTGEAGVIIELTPDGTVGLANRNDAIRPGNAKKSDVRKALKTAANHFEELVALWEKVNEADA